jgi:hypothetical protein
MTEISLPEVTRSTHPDHKALVDEIQRIDPAAGGPGNMIIFVLDRRSRCSSLKCFLDTLKVLENGAGSAGLGNGIFNMSEREIGASTEAA